MFRGFLSSLRVRILLVALAPCFAFAVVAGLAITQRVEERGRMVQVEGLIGLASEIGAFVHEAQRERGASSLFLGSKGTKFRTELDAQRALTDTARARLVQAYAAMDPTGFSASFAGRGRTLTAQLDQLTLLRKGVDGLAQTPAQALVSYSAVIGTALDLVRETSQVAASVDLAARVSAYSALLSLKELAGQELSLIHI